MKFDLIIIQQHCTHKDRKFTTHTPRILKDQLPPNGWIYDFEIITLADEISCSLASCNT